MNDILADQEIAGMTPELRRLVNRHVSECPTCQRTKKRIVSPVAILGAFAAVPPPLGLKERIFQSVSAAAGGPSGGDGGAGSTSGRSGVLSGARAGMQNIITARREAIRNVPRNRLAVLLIAGAMGIGGAAIVGLLALFGAFSGDGNPAVLGVASPPTPTPAATPWVGAWPTAEATSTPTPAATTTATAASSVVQPPLTVTPGPTPPVTGEATTPTSTAAPTPSPKPTPTRTPGATPTPTPVPSMTIAWFDVEPGNCEVYLSWNVTGDPAGTVDIWRKESSQVWANIFSPTVGMGEYMDPTYGVLTYILVARNSLNEPTTSDRIGVSAPCIQ